MKSQRFKKINNIIYFCVTFLFLTVSNCYISNLIVNKLHQNWHFSNSLINLVYVENTGAAFSIFEYASENLIIISLTILVSIFVYIIKNIKSSRMIELLLLSFLTSGILGNLAERMIFGYVRDYFNLSFVTFPIFNISDVFINIGVWGIIILILFSKKTNEQI